MAYEPGKHRSLEDITGSVVGWVVVFLAWAAQLAFIAVSYTHLTLPTNREV